MKKSVKLIFIALMITTLYSCTSSNIPPTINDSQNVYSNLENFSLRQEVSADTVLQGQMICIKLYIKNNSKAKDSVPNLSDYPLTNNLIGYSAEVMDTFKCNEQRLSVKHQSHKVNYLVFEPGEEKFFYRNLQYNVLICEEYGFVYRYMYPATYYAVSNLYNYTNTKFIKASNSPQFVVKENAEAVNDLVYCDKLISNGGDKNSFNALIKMDGFAEKYSGTPLEVDFFIKKIIYMFYRQIPFDDSTFKKIEKYIEDYPDLAETEQLLFYYILTKNPHSKDKGELDKYLMSLIERYKTRSAGIFAKAHMEREYYK